MPTSLDPQLRALQARLAERVAERGLPVEAPVDCQQCQDTGWRQVGAPGQERATRCTACEWWAKRAGHVPGLPAEEVQASLSSYRRTVYNARAIELAEGFAAGDVSNLYIEGTVGAGKTALACAILNALWARRVGCRLQRVLDYLRLPFEAMDERFEHLRETAVVVLDDIGADRRVDDRSDYGRRQMQALFDARLDLGHRTIFTSNLSLDQLAEHYRDDRLPSRIAGACDIARIYGPDLRTESAKGRARGRR
ncbi:MAG: AAA family ATPase [Vicinamibacterales bacterium]